MKPPKVSPLSLLASTLRHLAKSDADLDGNENSIERIKEWVSAEYIEAANRLAGEVCSNYSAAIEKVAATQEWPELYLAILEELEVFNYASIWLPSRYREYPEGFKGSETIIYEGVIRACEFCSDRLLRLAARVTVHERIVNPGRTLPPSVPVIDSANDKRDEFIYLMRLAGKTHREIAALVLEQFGDDLNPDSGIRGAIKRYCKRKNVDRPAPRRGPKKI